MPLASSDLSCTLSVGATSFRFRGKEKRWDGGGGRAYLRHAVHMVATLVGYRNGLGQQWLDHFSPWDCKQFFSEDEH